MEEADSESVEELVEEGQDFEASAVTGIEEADASQGEVRTKQVAEDDVPREYLENDLDRLNRKSPVTRNIRRKRRQPPPRASRNRTQHPPRESVGDQSMLQESVIGNLFLKSQSTSVWVNPGASRWARRTQNEPTAAGDASTSSPARR